MTSILGVEQRTPYLGDPGREEHALTRLSEPRGVEVGPEILERPLEEHDLADTRAVGGVVEVALAAE